MPLHVIGLGQMVNAQMAIPCATGNLLLESGLPPSRRGSSRWASPNFSDPWSPASSRKKATQTWTSRPRSSEPFTTTLCDCKPALGARSAAVPAGSVSMSFAKMLVAKAKWTTTISKLRHVSHCNLLLAAKAKWTTTISKLCHVSHCISEFVK